MFWSVESAELGPRQWEAEGAITEGVLGGLTRQAAGQAAEAAVTFERRHLLYQHDWWLQELVVVRVPWLSGTMVAQEVELSAKSLDTATQAGRVDPKQLAGLGMEPVGSVQEGLDPPMEVAEDAGTTVEVGRRIMLVEEGHRTQAESSLPIPKATKAATAT